MPRKLVTNRMKRDYKKVMTQLVTDLSQRVTVVQESPMFVDCPNCFESGTLIETSSGLREIQEFEPGDVVLDGYGQPRLVDKVFQKHGNFDFTSIKTHGNNIGLSATANHHLIVYENLGTRYAPILGVGKEKPIGEVKEGDLVSKAIASLQSTRREKITLDWKEHSDYGPKKNLPCVTELSDELLFAIGLYIAEGVTSKGRIISYCLNKGERELGNLVCSLWSSIADLSYSTQERPGTGNLVFEMYSSYLADLLDRWCGHGAHNKHIPEALYYCLDRQQTLALLFGYFVGDGHFEKQYGSITSVTASKVLAYQVYNLLLSCGFSASILKTDAKVDGNGVNHSEAYTVRYWPDESFIQRGTIRDKDRIYQVVRDVENYSRHTSVYNLEVQTEHSYIAEGFSVQNCIWDSINKMSSNVFDSSFIAPTTVFTSTSDERIITPISFSEGRCPVCIGQGQIFTNKEVCIDAMVNFLSGIGSRESSYSSLPAGREGMNLVVVKTLACHYELLLNNEVFFIHNNVKCVKFKPPIVRGLGGEEVVCETIMQTADEGQRTTGKFGGGDKMSRDDDPRRRIKGPSDIQDQRGKLRGR